MAYVLKSPSVLSVHIVVDDFRVIYVMNEGLTRLTFKCTECV